MTSTKAPRIALLFTQFSAYHVDRCEAVARRLAARAEVLAVEVAASSQTYAWERSDAVAGARKVTLFTDQPYESIGWLKRLRAQLQALDGCDVVLVGIGYNEFDVIALSWILRLRGARVIVLSESKHDDKPRSWWKERRKALILRAYDGAIVGARRHIDYFRSLGFRSRAVLPGYDTVGLERIRAMAGLPQAPDGAAFHDRHFVFVGRFVTKKNLLELVDGYAAYVQSVETPRRLILVGSGPLEAGLRMRATALGLQDLIDFSGFLGAREVAHLLGRSLALVLVSTEEQWGLVVNEALALGLPAILSPAVGAGDVLVRDGINGHIVANGDPAALGQAMLALAKDEAHWRSMALASRERAQWGDTERLADAVAVLLGLDDGQGARRLRHFEAAIAS